MKAPGGSKQESNNTHYLFQNSHAAEIRAEIKNMKGDATHDAAVTNQILIYDGLDHSSIGGGNSNQIQANQNQILSEKLTEFEESVNMGYKKEKSRMA